MPTKERAAEIRKLSDELAIKKAQVIGCASWYSYVDPVLTESERTEIMRLWHGLDGKTSWTDAMFVWLDKTEA